MRGGMLGTEVDLEPTFGLSHERVRPFDLAALSEPELLLEVLTRGAACEVRKVASSIEFGGSACFLSGPRQAVLVHHMFVPVSSGVGEG
jgi:hypothetical protein